MPNYVYECLLCGRQFEKIVPVAERRSTACLECGHLSLKKPSSPAIQFKGSGFYVNDYGKKV